jgi:COMPASS component SWD2
MTDFDMGAVIHGEGVVTNLDFHRDGRWLVMSTNENSIHLIDALAGAEKKKLYAKSSGIGKIKFTHHESCVLLSAEKKTNDIRYLCMYDNRYLRSFEGHSSKVTSLSMCPIDDCFITASLDRSVCLWNISSPHTSPIAKITLPKQMEQPYASFDESGIVFGVMCLDSSTRKHCIKLFDARNYENGPFQNVAPDSSLFESAIAKIAPTLSPSAVSQRYQQAPWTSFDFSTDGNNLLVNTQSDMLYVLDGFNPETDPIVLNGRRNDSGLRLGACFSSNSKQVLTGNEDNQVLIYDTLSGELKSTLDGHVAPVGCVKFNPKYDEFATGCVNTVLWIPKEL